MARSTEPVPHKPVHRGGSPQVVLVVQKVDVLVVLPFYGTQISTEPEFVLAMFSQPIAKFLAVVISAYLLEFPVHSSAGGRA